MQIVIIPVLDGAFHHGIIRRPPRPRRPRGRVGGGVVDGHVGVHRRSVHNRRRLDRRDVRGGG